MGGTTSSFKNTNHMSDLLHNLIPLLPILNIYLGILISLCIILGDC